MSHSEQAFLEQMIDLAHLLGWKVVHFRPGMTKSGWRTPVAGDAAGFPDLLLVKEFDNEATLLAVEVKSERGKLSGQQKEWLEIMSKVTKVYSFVWKPKDFEDIVALLKKPGDEQ